MSVFWYGIEYKTVQVNGQRFIGPPENVSEPSYEWEIFVKHLPRSLFERELVPFFSSVGFVYQIRLLMCFSGLNRGIAYVRYSNEQDFLRALKIFHDLPMGQHKLYATKSTNLRTLVLLNIEPYITNSTIQGFIESECGGGCVYIGYGKRTPRKKFAIIQFSCHYETALARRKLIPFVTLFGDDCCLKWHKNSKARLERQRVNVKEEHVMNY
ncbi:dead end protein homolog 1-like [Toxorhynchites rutilus septentrionalis]|uniref:dead end protein homolog 1-like n=1 Tax=Toxorhynchites rutilus septentrionalis TaxID=329112 RepID=UPI002479AE5D|nr:dead end protein homolog 1-like [Toxorhynchites rutilus septentrionalis]